MLVDWDGRIIAESFAQAQGEWMTEEYVPFEGKLVFNVPPDAGPQSLLGTLILRKDNPSGLPEHDDAFEIPVRFDKSDQTYLPPTYPDPGTPPESPKPGDNAAITVPLGGEGSMLGLSIEAVRVLEDSRCPQGAQCVWAGRVRIATVWTYRDGETVRDIELELGVPKSSGPYQVTLAEVSPTYRIMGDDPQDYIFTFKVRILEPESPT